MPSVYGARLTTFEDSEKESEYGYVRKVVSREIRKILTQRAASFNIALDDVSITGLTFGKEFTAAIEAKQIATEEAERAKFVVEKASRTREVLLLEPNVKPRVLN